MKNYPLIFNNVTILNLNESFGVREVIIKYYREIFYYLSCPKKNSNFYFTYFDG
jgi:hypothetical protein